MMLKKTIFSVLFGFLFKRNKLSWGQEGFQSTHSLGLKHRVNQSDAVNMQIWTQTKLKVSKPISIPTLMGSLEVSYTLFSAVGHMQPCNMFKHCALIKKKKKVVQVHLWSEVVPWWQPEISFQCRSFLDIFFLLLCLCTSSFGQHILPSLSCCFVMNSYFSMGPLLILPYNTSMW